MPKCTHARTHTLTHITHWHACTRTPCDTHARTHRLLVATCDWPAHTLTHTQAHTHAHTHTAGPPPPPPPPKEVWRDLTHTEALSNTVAYRAWHSHTHDCHIHITHWVTHVTHTHTDTYIHSPSLSHTHTAQSHWNTDTHGTQCQCSGVLFNHWSSLIWYRIPLTSPPPPPPPPPPEFSR